MGQAVCAVRQQMPGYTWFQVNGLKGNSRLAVRLEARLIKLKGVTGVKADTRRGWLKLCYAEDPVMQRPQNLTEPEDLPVGRQMFNVALGGAALALVGLKRYTVGPSALAASRSIFNLNAAAALISGYPILHSGFKGLTRGRINHDLIIGAVGLGTILLRESIPGLLVFWLTNLTALGQSMVLRASQKAVKEQYGPAVQKKSSRNTGLWNAQAAGLAQREVPLSFGLAALTGVVTGQLSRSLAMLLAANPAPAGLAAAATRSAVLAAAARQNILIQHPHVVEDLLRVDTILVSDQTLYDQVVKNILPARMQVEVAPVENKPAYLLSLQKQGRTVAYISPDPAEAGLLRAAQVGIWLSGREPAPGQAVTTDIIMPQLSGLSFLLKLSMVAEKHFQHSFSLVLAVNLLGLGLGAAGWLSPVGATVYNNLTGVWAALRSVGLHQQFRRRSRSVSPVKSHRHQIQPVNHAVQPCEQWPHLPAQEVLDLLRVRLEQGLTAEEAGQKLALYGENRLTETKPVGLLTRMTRQLRDFLVQTLMGSSVVCILLGEIYDALAIISILFLNALLGALQEQKAEGALAALKGMTAPTARVLRSGSQLTVPASQVVPGDIIYLEQGDIVSADVRLISVTNLTVDESTLTGESYPVLKHSDQADQCLPLLDCHNMAFMGTIVNQGRATAVVVHTGMQTQIGKIAGMLNKDDNEETPLQKRMLKVGHTVLKGSLAVSGLVVVVGLLRGGSPMQMFLTGVSLAVAAIPEGLPAVVTLAMAAGVKRMAAKNAVVRRLPAVETLGSATVICTDKTGTLTANEQTVKVVYTGDKMWQAGGNGYNPENGRFTTTDGDTGEQQDLVAVLTAACLCNNAKLTYTVKRQRPAHKKVKSWSIQGDPTEGALLVAGAKAGLDLAKLAAWKRLAEIPFDSIRGEMTVLCQNQEGENFSFVKGALEVLVQQCRSIWRSGGVHQLDDDTRRQINDINESLTSQGMRVLAVAYQPLDQPALDEQNERLVFLGLIGMVDPPRPEVGPAIANCQQAGIKVMMITGDHRNTALAVAREMGLPAEKALTGKELDGLSPEALVQELATVRIFARMLPEHKLRLVQALQAGGEVVAMIGDGVNDAPAVKQAHIGVAMGATGTEVTKQTADIILADDNFATMVEAVRQGRGIYGNIRQSVRYLLATNVGEVIMMFLAVATGMPLPLLPIQLLWLNLLGDGLPALALGIDQPGSGLMQLPPRPVKENFFAGHLGHKIISRGITIGLTGLGSFYLALRNGDLTRARTVALAAITGSQMLHAVDCREQPGVAKNKYLGQSVGLSAALLGGAVYLPFARNIFKTVPLGLMDWSTVALAMALSAGADKTVTGLLTGPKDSGILENESVPGQKSLPH